MHEGAPGRLIGEPEDRTLFERHEVGQRVDVALIDRDDFRVGAPRHGREYALAETDLGDARADAAHDACDLASGTERQLGPVLIRALDDEDVREVATDGADLDDDLARVRSRGRRV